jgi:hypothetical protein
MFRWVNKHQKWVYLAIAGAMLVGTIYSFGGPAGQSPRDPFLIVNGRRVPYLRFQKFMANLRAQSAAQGRPFTDEQAAYARQQVLQGFVQECLFLDQAEAFGLLVSDAEVDSLTRQVPGFQENGRFNPLLYDAFLRRAGLSDAEFREERRREILTQKTQSLMASGVKVSRWEFNEKIAAVHSRGTPDQQKSLRENPGQLMDELRQEEGRAALREWHTLAAARMKTRILLDRFEPPVTKP